MLELARQQVLEDRVDDQTLTELNSNELAINTSSIHDELAQFEESLRQMQTQREAQDVLMVESNTSLTHGRENENHGKPMLDSDRAKGLINDCHAVSAGKFRKYAGNWISRPMGHLLH